METNITINVDGVDYSAISINGRISDSNWNHRESKYIKLKMEAMDAVNIFRDGISWSIIEKVEAERVLLDENGNIVYDENGGVVLEHIEDVRREYDNSDFCVLGDIVIHPDGTCTVAMGKETAEEKLITMMYGGVE